jgi:hypothetical protein
MERFPAVARARKICNRSIVVRRTILGQRHRFAAAFPTAPDVGSLHDSQAVFSARTEPTSGSIQTIAARSNASFIPPYAASVAIIGFGAIP